MKTSREWWIVKEKGYSTWVADEPPCSADTTDEIHVIEKQAYDELLNLYDKNLTKYFRVEEDLQDCIDLLREFAGTCGSGAADIPEEVRQFLKEKNWKC